jgi:hypothetical protein
MPLVGKPRGLAPRCQARPSREFLGRDELGLSTVSKTDGAGFDPLATCSRGLGLADGERGEEAKAQLGESPGDHAWRADPLEGISIS